jgi:hypothetical protein
VAFTSEFGFDWRFSPVRSLIAPPGTGFLSGDTLYVQLTLQEAIGTVVENVVIPIVWDLVQAVPFLIRPYWSYGLPGFDGGGGGHDPMLDQILAAVQHLYRNVP